MHPRKIILLLASVLACFGLIGTAGAAMASPGPTAAHHATAVAPAKTGTVHRTFAATAATPGPNELARTALSLRPDSGYNATVYWALDDMTRTLHVVLAHQVPGTSCNLLAAHLCYQWAYSIGDTSGSFQTLQNVDSPGFFDRNLDVAERGSFSGAQYGTVYTTYKNAFPAGVPAAENDNGTLAGTSSTRWPCLMFATAAACVNAGATSFSYNYAVAKGADAQCPLGHWGWTDSTLGNVAITGDILAPDKANCASTPNTTGVTLTRTTSVVRLGVQAAPSGCSRSDFYFQATNGGQNYQIDNGGNQDITLQFTTNACFHLINSDAPGWYFIEDNYGRCINAVNPGGGTPILVLSSCVFSGDSLENFSPFGHEWENRHYGGIDGWMTSDGNAGSAVILFSGSGWATPEAVRSGQRLAA